MTLIARPDDMMKRSDTEAKMRNAAKSHDATISDAELELDLERAVERATLALENRALRIGEDDDELLDGSEIKIDAESVLVS